MMSRSLDTGGFIHACAGFHPPCDTAVVYLCAVHRGNGRNPDCTQPLSMTLEQLLAAENIIKSVHKCGTGVRWKASVQRLEISKLRIAGRIKEQLLTGNYVSRGYHQFSIIERGVQRQIHSLHVYDRAVQKLFCNYALKPVVYPHLIFDNSASQENKGTDFALRRLKEHLRWHLARYGKTGAIAVLDYSKFSVRFPMTGQSSL